MGKVRSITLRRWGEKQVKVTVTHQGALRVDIHKYGGFSEFGYLTRSEARRLCEWLTKLLEEEEKP